MTLEDTMSYSSANLAQMGGQNLDSSSDLVSPKPGLARQECPQGLPKLVPHRLRQASQAQANTGSPWQASRPPGWQP
jgi:hypothetical protein